MAYRVFTLPVRDPGAAETELNGFLASQQTIGPDRPGPGHQQIGARAGCGSRRRTGGEVWRAHPGGEPEQQPGFSCGPSPAVEVDSRRTGPTALPSRRLLRQPAFGPIRQTGGRGQTTPFLGKFSRLNVDRVRRDGSFVFPGTGRTDEEGESRDSSRRNGREPAVSRAAERRVRLSHALGARHAEDRRQLRIGRRRATQRGLSQSRARSAGSSENSAPRDRPHTIRGAGDPSSPRERRVAHRSAFPSPLWPRLACVAEKIFGFRTACRFFGDDRLCRLRNRGKSRIYATYLRKVDIISIELPHCCNRRTLPTRRMDYYGTV